MKILIISEVFWPEDFLVNELARSWKDSGHEVEVVSQYPSYPGSYVYEGYKNRDRCVEDWQGIKIHRFPFIEGYKFNKKKKYINYLLFVHDANRIVKKIGGRFDRIFVSQTGPLTVALPAITIKKKYGTRIAIYTYDIWPDVLYSYGIPRKWPFTAILKNFVKRVYGKFDDILISSDKFREVIEKYTDKEIIYAPNWIRNQGNSVESTLRFDSSEFNFTFIGNISSAQNLLNVVKGFTVADIPNTSLNIVGDGSGISELKEFLSYNPMAKVYLRGRFPYNQMQDILKQSNVCVISLVSGSALDLTEPLKLQDYLLSGKPIYGVINGSVREIIQHNELGLCADPANIDSIAKGFKKMIEFYKRKGGGLSGRAKLLMNERFNKQKVIAQINQTIGLESVNGKTKLSQNNP